MISLGYERKLKYVLVEYVLVQIAFLKTTDVIYFHCLVAQVINSIVKNFTKNPYKHKFYLLIAWTI